MIFVNTKIEARDLARFLQRAQVNARALHGDQTQTERLATLDEFKNGTVPILVATDVAARGLDIADMPCVVNFDLPYNAEDYVHRIGRTGRAGASGRALSLVTEDDERLLSAIKKLTKQEFELRTVSKPERTRTRPTSEHNDHGSAEARIRNIEKSSPHRRSAIDEDELNYLRRQMSVSDDPFFSQPYVASSEANQTHSKPDLAHTHLSSRMPLVKTKKPVAALFQMNKKK